MKKYYGAAAHSEVNRWAAFFGIPVYLICLVVKMILKWGNVWESTTSLVP